MSTEYKEGSHDEFIRYLFGNEPQEPKTISLESPPHEVSKNIHLHTFEQLLMIFVDGLKYLYGRDGKVDVNTLTLENIQKVRRYFHSIHYDAIVETFETIHEYQFRYPNYFKDQDKITDACVLKDFFYEIYGINNRVFRISFTELLNLC